jgi:hypothetical protein
MLICPKLQTVINNFLTKDSFGKDDQMIIFVDQRLIADLMLKTIISEVPLFQNKNKERIDAVYSHANKSIFKKIFNKTKVQSDQVMTLFDDILNTQYTNGRSLERQKSTINAFKDGH